MLADLVRQTLSLHERVGSEDETNLNSAQNIIVGQIHMILLTEVTSFSGSPPSMLNNSLVPWLSPQKLGREPGDEANPNSPPPIFRGESLGTRLAQQ